MAALAAAADLEAGSVAVVAKVVEPEVVLAAAWNEAGVAEDEAVPAAAWNAAGQVALEEVEEDSEAVEAGWNVAVVGLAAAYHHKTLRAAYSAEAQQWGLMAEKAAARPVE